MENTTHSFRETKLLFQLIQESTVKSKTVMSWSSRKKKEGHFFTVYFVRRKFIWHLCLDRKCIECTFRIYIHLHIKNITSYFFCLFLKSSEAFSVSWNAFLDFLLNNYSVIFWLYIHSRKRTEKCISYEWQ